MATLISWDLAAGETDPEDGSIGWRERFGRGFATELIDGQVWGLLEHTPETDFPEARFEPPLEIRQVVAEHTLWVPSTAPSERPGWFNLAAIGDPIVGPVFLWSLWREHLYLRVGARGPSLVRVPAELGSQVPLRWGVRITEERIEVLFDPRADLGARDKMVGGEGLAPIYDEPLVSRHASLYVAACAQNAAFGGCRKRPFAVWHSPFSLELS